MTQTGADLVVAALVEAGVPHLFSVSGNQILSIYDATIGRPVRIVHTRHEAAAVHMADAWGRLTDEPGVALVTAAPGHLNALSACYGALMAESPVVLLSGHAPRGELGLGAFQELDQVAAARPVVKAAWRADEPARLGEAVRTALALARHGRPGPVHVSLPGDVLEAVVEDVPPPTADRAPAALAPLGDAEVAEILAVLGEAKRPLVITGPALARGWRRAAVARLAAATGVPVLPMESPRGVNDPWLHGASACLAEADLVLLLGKAPDFSLRFGRPPGLGTGCRLVQVAADPPLRRQEPRLHRVVVADPAGAAERLAGAARERTWAPSGWRDAVLRARQATPPAWAELRRSPATPLHPLRVCAALQPWLERGAVLVVDGGEFGQWVQAGLEASERLVNGPSGSIGSALPMALAAKLARPDRVVVAALGDGTFGFHAFELDTAVRYGLPVVTVVGNDARWNAEHQLQLQHYGAERAVGCELLPSRYDQVAVALGGHGEHVERAEALAGALERAVASGKPACVNVRIEGVPAPTFRAAAPAH